MSTASSEETAADAAEVSIRILSGDFTRFCPVADVPSGGRKALKLNNTWVMVLNINDRLFAIAGICSHQAKPLLQGRVRNLKITCPVHGARFDLVTGEALDLPATKPIQTYETRVVDDWIEVLL
jgi:3-phenylpropionate/trans-cinnamate dioxygenase ferredoxin subunit